MSATAEVSSPEKRKRSSVGTPGKADRTRRFSERLVHAALFFCAAVSVATTLGIVFVLVFESRGFFAEVSLKEFLTSTRWTPLLKPQHFGVRPLVSGTLLVVSFWLCHVHWVKPHHCWPWGR